MIFLNLRLIDPDVQVYIRADLIATITGLESAGGSRLTLTSSAAREVIYVEQDPDQVTEMIFETEKEANETY